MSQRIRAKMSVASVEELRSFKEGDPSGNQALYTGEKYGERVKLYAVCGGKNEEDNVYAKYTPSASFELHIDNPACWGFYVPGKSYYVDTIPAES